MIHERYQNLSEEEKKKRQNGPERYKNLSDEKNTLVEYRKNLIEWEKKKGNVIRKSIRKSVRNFWFSGLASSLMKYYKLFKLGARKFHFPKYKKHFKSWFYSPFEHGDILLEI